MKNPDFSVVIAGDLNRFDVSGVCSLLDLCNLNNCATYANSELDYILLSQRISEYYTISRTVPFDRSKVPHKSLLASPLSRSIKSSDFVVRRVYDLRSSFIERFARNVSAVDWNFLDDSQLSLYEKCLIFQSTLEAIACECIPVSYVKLSASDKPWISPLVKDLINKRWSAFRRSDFTAYNHFKLKVRTEIQRAKGLWTKRMQESDVWKTIRIHLGRNSSNSVMSLLSQHKSKEEALNAINSYLFSVFEESDWSSVTNLISALPTDGDKWKIDASPFQVLRYIQRMNVRKSSPDIPNVLYKSVAHQISSPLSKLLKLSFELGRAPHPWKRVVITPVPKVRNPTMADIRPISLLPPLAKIMERVVLSSVKNQLLKNYGTNQFGFRPHSSTQCALTYLHNQVTIYLDDPSTSGVAVIAYDYSKAFDRLRFDLIIQRLVDCDFPPKSIVWIADYLKHRTQIVRVGEAESREINISSGVPQGSVLGPFLFSFATAT